MAAIYTTRENDVLDEVVRRYYDRQDNGLVEAVLEANRGLADYGPTLPAGLEITMPEAPAPQPAQRLQLFS
jgi:phage tail protein X